MELSVPEDSGQIGNWEVKDGTLIFDLAGEGRYAGHWFYFDLSHAPPGRLPVVIRNWASSYYSGAWEGYRPFYRAGGEWARCEAAHLTDAGCEFVVPAGSPASSAPSPSSPSSLEIAWYQPYPLGLYRDWMGSLAGNPAVTVRSLGPPDLDCLEFGRPDQPTVVVIGRQHPGEVMASFFLERFVSALLDQPIHLAVVPIMNPSGVAGGRHRLNSSLVDYNRSWSNGADSPVEVQKVRDLLPSLARLDLFLDIHGDEDTTTCDSYLRRLPAHVLPTAGRRLQHRFLSALAAQGTATVALAPRSQIRSTVKRWLRRTGDYRAASPRQQQTAVDYVSRTYRVPAYTIEISAHRTGPGQAGQIGTSVATAILASLARPG